MNRKSGKVRAEALRLVESGVSQRSAAAQVSKRFRTSVSASSVGKWVAAAASAPTSEEIPQPDALPPPAAEAPAATPPLDVHEHTRRQLAAAMRRSDEASADGNHTAAQRYSKQAADLTLLLARLDKERRGDVDAVTIPRDEFDAADQQARDILGALRADLARTGGLVCNHCGREIRIALAKGETP